MSSAPKLNTNVPVRFGLAALAGGVALASAMFAIEVDQGPVAVAAAVKRAEPVIVRHDSAGTLGQMHVTAGMDVPAGALLVQFDRRHIESELAALRKRIDARRMEIDGLKQEAAALAAAGDKTVARARIAALDAEAVEADRVIVGHSARIALLEGQRERLDIRAPVAGRIVDITSSAPGAAFAAKEAIVTIRPSVNRLQIDAVWPSSSGAAPAVGQTTRVWLAGAFGLGTTHAGKVESVGAETVSETADVRPSIDSRARIALDVTGTSLADPREGPVFVNVQLVTGTRSLAEHLFAPLIVRRVSERTSSEGISR
jgi:multidrug resistance efflux pump